MFLALGLKERDRNEAVATFREGVRQLDRLADSGGDVMRDMEIAALTMVAEQIDPSLVPEIFWRALAARPPSGDPRDESDGSLTATAMLLSRFDRAVASALLVPVVAELEKAREAGSRLSFEFVALALIDPRKAASIIDRIPLSRDLSPNSNWTRIRVAETLASSREARWKRIWRSVSSVAGILFERDIQ